MPHARIAFPSRVLTLQYRKRPAGRPPGYRWPTRSVGYSSRCFTGLHDRTQGLAAPVARAAARPLSIRHREMDRPAHPGPTAFTRDGRPAPHGTGAGRACIGNPSRHPRRSAGRARRVVTPATFAASRSLMVDAPSPDLTGDRNTYYTARPTRTARKREGIVKKKTGGRRASGKPRPPAPPHVLVFPRVAHTESRPSFVRRLPVRPHSSVRPPGGRVFFRGASWAFRFRCRPFPQR